MIPRRLSIVWLVSLLALAGCTHGLKIHDRPISFSSDRVTGTMQYITDHYGEEPGDISIVPRIIVLHWTAIDGFEESFAAFDPEGLGGSRPALAAAGQVNVSIQFLVDRDGTVHRLMPETWMARHCIGLNYSTIGVENVGGGDGIDNLTDEQIAANIRLVRYLATQYPTIQYLIGHMEYREFESHPLWLELDEGYRTEKTDPGDRFMTAVREAVADLELEGPPEADQGSN
jgi:N-acetyl-anhydromuramyl-L-alanine amidase AmpD